MNFNKKLAKSRKFKLFSLFLLLFSQKMTIWGYKVNFGGPVCEEGVCAKKFAGMALVRLTSRAGAAAPAGLFRELKHLHFLLEKRPLVTFQGGSGGAIP